MSDPDSTMPDAGPPIFGGRVTGEYTASLVHRIAELEAERDRYRDAALAAVESLNEWREAPPGRQPGFKVLHARTLLLAALEAGS